MATNSGPTSTLCHWVCSTQYQDLPSEVRLETFTHLYDQLGCMVASATLPSCQPVVDLVRKMGGPEECSIIGHPVRAPLANAALANGTIGHGDELDSMGQQRTGHYAATTVPTAVTVGQYVCATGKELLRALALGSEVAARLQNILGQHSTRDQFTDTVACNLGAAATAGLLLGLNAQQMEHAMGLAASGSCSLRSHVLGALHQVKSLYHGRAAQGGVLSALLARDGFQGPLEILTVENGFFDAFLGLPAVGHEATIGLGKDYLIREIAYKRYSVGGPDQAPVYALLELMKSHKLTAEALEEIEVKVSQRAFKTVTLGQNPSIHLETLLSMAAVYMKLSFEHVHDPAYQEDPRVKVFRERTPITIVPRPEPATVGERLDMSIAIRTRAGQVLRQELRYPLMSEREIQEKFRDLMGLRLTPDMVTDLERKIKAIEGVDNVAPLIRELELAY